MVDENMTTESVETKDNYNELVDQVTELKNNTVPKADFDKLQNQYNHLFGEYIKGKKDDNDFIKEPTEEDLKKQYLKNCEELANDKHMSNIEKAKRYLSIRDYRLSQGLGDIFLPQAGQPSQDDVEKAENQAILMQDAISQSEDSDLRYNAYITDHLRDNMSILKRK